MVIRSLSLIALLFLFAELFAREENKSEPAQDISLEINDSVESTSPPKRSSMVGTLEDAARKLKSEKVEQRIGAAKLLGKYASLQVGLLLIGALDDESELVRRAALVSLVEHFNNGSPIYEKSLAEKIFSKIGDSDVEVRRETSALISRLVPGLMRSGMERVVVNGRTIFRSIPGRLREDLRLLAEKALLDPDSIVRQNILRYHYSLRFQIAPQTIGQLLEDQDVAVLLVALDQVRMYASQTGVLSKLENLTVHPEVGVRAKLEKTVFSLSRSFPDYRKILRLLTNDKQDEIATLAAVDLARLGERVSPGMIDRIIKYLTNARGLYGETETLFHSLSALGQDSLRIYQALLKHPSSSMRANAWERYLNISEGWKTPSVWIPALEDRDPKVRSAVLALVRGRVEKINENDLRLLVDHQFSGVRALAAELLLAADTEVVDDCFFDLLIDEDSLVRSTTLRALARLRHKEWINLHRRSLNDDDYTLQRAAMDGLLGDREEGVPALLEFVRRYPSARISSLARAELKKMGIDP